MSGTQEQDSADAGPPIRAYLAALVPSAGADQDPRYERGRAAIEQMARTPQRRLAYLRLTSQQLADVMHFKNASKVNERCDELAVIGLQLILSVVDENMPRDSRQ
jgi:hypothetical protein